MSEWDAFPAVGATPTPARPAAARPASRAAIQFADDNDALIRTVIGEARGESPQGRQAVAAVIRNRARQRGLTPTDVVLERNQFEPWGNPETARSLMGISQSDPLYQEVAQQIAGEVDPTGGASHFYAPKAQKALGRARPSWDNGTGTAIGNHLFFNLDGLGGGSVAQGEEDGWGAFPEAAPDASGAATSSAPPGATPATAIDLSTARYQDEIDALKKGAWVREKGSDKPYQLEADAFPDAMRPIDRPQGGNIAVRPPNLEDRIGAVATAASEQIPFLDESVAFTTGLATGEGYGAMREAQALNAQRLNQTERAARNVGGVAGFGVGMLAPGGAYIGRGVGGADRALRAAQVGGGYGALYGAGAEDGGLAARLRGGAEGAALGAVTGGLVQRGTDRVADRILSGAARRAESPSDARILSQAGVELTPGQMLGGGFKRAEDAMTSIPFMGDTIRGAQRRGLESFNDAAIADALAQSGAQTTQRGRGRVRDVAEQFGRNYDAALDPVTDIPRPEGYVEALTALADDAALPPSIRRNLRSLITNTVGRADESIDGKEWKRIDSELSADIRAADRAAANAPEQRLLRDKLREVRGLWSDRLGAAAPDALEAVRATDDAYANFKIIQKAMSDAASAGRGGEASPASMNRAVRQAAGEGQYSRGAGRLQELSDAAMTVLPSSVPDSGTPLRSLLTAGGIGGGAAVLGNPAGQAAALAGGAGIGLGSLAYSRPVQSMLNRAYRATGREDVSRQAASLFDQVYQNPAAVPLYMQILERLQQEQAAPSPAQVGSQTQRQAQGPMR